MTTIFNRMSALPAEKRDELNGKFEKAAQTTAAEPIAVVGIGCRLPGGAAGPDAYWDMLASGTDAIVEVPADRWDADEYYDPDTLAPGKMSSKWGGFLADDVAGFDADFFGISPREAEAMDPQQRLMLEVAWEALEHAGMSPEKLAGIRAAVMMGIYYTEYQGISGSNPDAIDGYTATGTAHAVAVGRIAYLLGLRGPAVAMDSACSSSLVTIHMACQSLRMRESDLALAGGVSLILRPETQIAMAKWGMLSPRGRCHSFDAGADGFVRGEGTGVVVLKRLTDAMRDGDRVLAVVRGSAVNQDGRSNGLTAPNTIAQSEVIRQALRWANVPPGSVNLIEAHGTGTGLGDPIEFEALADVYGKGPDRCALGAVKTNIGHLEAAAGIAGFIKAALAVQRGQIPPNLHFSKWNPSIDPTPTRLFIPTEMTPWPAAEGPRRAAVSSFGLGGTNAHVVLEQGPDPVPGPASTDPVSTLVISGKTEQRVADWAATLADWLAGPGAEVPLADIAGTLNHHRSRYAKFATVSACTAEQAVTGLRAVAGGYPAPGVVGTRTAGAGQGGKGTVFLYSGQGSQWAGMGRQLLADEPAFAAAVDELEPDFVAQVGFSLRGVLESGEPVVGIDRIQPVLVGMQLALTALWRSHGVEPDAVIGHSMGEVAAAVVAGALSPADGLKVIATRSKLMARLSGQGAMALLELEAEAAEKLVAEHPGITVAVYAAPQQTVIAGPPEQVDAVVAIVDAQGKLARRVEVDVASHHPTVDPILGELRTALADLKPMAPKIPLISTVGQTGSDTPRFDAGYWVHNLRNPVRFAQAVTAAAAGHATFIEVSPHPLLSHAINGNLEAARPAGDASVTGTLLREQPEALSFHTNLAAVAPPSAEAPHSDGGIGRADLPPRPWQHVRYWAAPTAASRNAADVHPLLGIHVELPAGHGHVWQADVGTDFVAWMAHHKVHGQVVMPATGFAEMALAAAGEALGLPPSAVAVDRVEVEQMLRVDERTEVTTRLLQDADGSDELRIEIHSRPAGGSWSRHAVARAAAAEPASVPQRPAPTSGGTALSPADLYTELRRTGLQHGPAFAALTRIVRKPGGASEAEIVLPDEATAHRGYRIHPVMLDAALQCLAAALPDESLSGSPGAEEATYLPVAVETIRVFGDVGRRARGHAELVSHDDGGIMGRVTLTDDTGTVTAELSGIYLQRVQRRTVPLPLTQKIFDTEWVDVPAPAQPPAAAGGSWLVLTEPGESEALAADFAARFGSDSRRVITADLSSEAAVREAFTRTADDPDRPPVGVVVLAAGGTFGDSDNAAPARGRDLAWSVASTVRTIVGGWHGTAPRLWLVGRNGLTVDPAESGDPSICALKGLVRVLAYEHPDLHTGLVDLDGSADPAAALITELGLAGTDDVVAWRGEHRYAERLKRATLTPTGVPAVRSDGAYVLTGGLGGIGLVVARWLIDHGAARIVLNSRSQPSEEQRAILTELEARAQIAVVSGDLATPGVAESLMAAAEQTGLTLRGVVHGAAVIDDQIVVGIDKDTLDRVWAPKAAAALRLHQASLGKELDWWVGFSSTSSLLGAPGQASYAAASAWLDGLVAWRRAAGLPAITINWGQWSGVGVAQELKFSALDPINPDEGMEALEAILGGDLSRIGVARLRLDRVAAAFPELQQLGYFATLAEELDLDDEDDDWPGPEGLKQLDPAEAAKAVVARLGSRIMAIMGYPKGSVIDPARPLTELGMDSLMAVRIRNTVRGDFGAEPPVALLLQGASLTDLAADLARQLGLAQQENADGAGDGGGVRGRAQQRAAARQRAASRRKVGDRT